MDISILSVFPELYTSFLSTSLLRRAQEQNIVHVDVDSFFSYVSSKERIDAPTFGPGPGMVIKPTVVQKAIEAKQRQHGSAFKIFFSPQGRHLDQAFVKKIAKKFQECGHLMMVAGRYEGMDARVEEYYADELVSVGDFVLMGGDIPAMMLLEAVLRLVPGVVGKQESVEQDSFTGSFLDYPEYTQPIVWKGLQVPEVIRSGNHGAIKNWRMRKAAEKTVMHHFDWLRSNAIDSQEDKVLVREVMPSHYVALSHTDVLIGEEKKQGTTSVTSIDIHDIARTSRTYGVENFFIVTPLKDQQKIVRTVLDFWQKGVGVTYNKHRHEAINRVDIVNSIDEVSACIEKKEGVKPLIIATSARVSGHDKIITYYDQAQVWKHKRPVLFVFGTGRGLTESIIQRCDYLLLPIQGFSDFNHLSVRSAVTAVLDRWLGINIKRK